MKIFLLIISILAINLISFTAISEENWKLTKESEYCFIQSTPITTDIPDGKIRGNYGILVYTMNNNPDLIVQISAGFNYKSIDSVIVKIDEGDYNFYTDEDTAWAKNDKKVIFAMKKGLKLITTGVSSKGTKVTDTFSLSGFTAAVNKLSNDC
jgi:hypothetical protein|tara:strand:- start:605 stop:1063 length:459 start_codon:yes stop_codon:yes gene_type:complete